MRSSGIVMPAQAGIQSTTETKFVLVNTLDASLRWHDDFLETDGR
jgi:hypothetical protein